MRGLKEGEKIDDLTLPFRRLAAGCRQQAGAHLEETLLERFRERQKRALSKWLYLAGAAAILVLIAGYLVVSRAHKAIPAEPDAAQVLEGFTPLPYAASGVPLGEAVILRIQVPAESVGINAAGSAMERTQFVPADLLIGEDGVPRAVRLAR